MDTERNPAHEPPLEVKNHGVPAMPEAPFLEIHKPELREDSKATDARVKVGHAVGNIAKRFFDPHGTGIEINPHSDGFASAFAQSAELLANPDRPIFEAGLQGGGALTIADILLPATNGGDAGWKMIEVKSLARIKNYSISLLVREAPRDLTGLTVFSPRPEG